jgi:hypothetical protein
MEKGSMRMAEPRRPVNPQAMKPPTIEPPMEPDEPSERPPIDWKKPPFLIAYGLIGLVCVILLFKWVFGSSRNPNLARVRGSVTLEGKALAGAVVTFHPVAKGGNTAVGATDRFGKFDLKTAGLGAGALAGDYRVTVTKFASDEKMMSPEEAKQYLSREGKPPPQPKASNLAPAKYAAVETSGLTATVKLRGPNQFQLKLE